ncbi:twin-arginine translocation signal domain-containing protein, partial [Streptomyces fimicarius]
MTNRGTTRRTVLTGAAALGAAATLPLPLAGPAHAGSGTARTGAPDAAALRARWHTLLTGGPDLDRDDERIAAAVARVGRAG